MNKNQKIRQPIVTILGHVDHGKTTLLDNIRGTAIAKAEAGKITQQISASPVPSNIVRKICGSLLDKLNIELTIPGLLFIDSPGHEAFTTLRKRGGAIADLAVLVVDINEGFQPQTDESLNYLKQFKTPFVVAATKIDRILGWIPEEGCSFSQALENQTERTSDELEKKIYNIIGQLMQRGFQAERIDRISDFEKQVVVVPVSGITGEGVSDLLMTLAGMAQKYLKKGLVIETSEGKGTVLEVKEFKGLGMTIDVILYDGEIKKGDYIAIGGQKTVVTRIKALLEPKPSSELKTERDFQQISSISAAAGVKIAAPGLEDVIAGSPLRAVSDKSGLEKIKEEIKHEIDEVEIETDKTGVIVKADTLGGLEALIKSLGDMDIPIRKAVVGNVLRSDVMEIKVLEEPVIFAFNLKITPEIEKLAKDNNVRIFSSDVIYSLIEGYQKWIKEKKKRAEEALLESVTRPGRIKVLPKFVFRQKKPAVFGVEVLRGVIKPGYVLMNGKKILGEVKEIQKEGKNIEEAVRGDRIAVSMPDVIIGKHVNEGDVLDVYLSEDDIEALKGIIDKIKGDEKELLEEMGYI